MKKYLSKIKDVYERGENIISYLKESENSEINNSEIIQASYDLQAGTYQKRFYKNPDEKIKYCRELANSISQFEDIKSILLVGCGELITLSLLVKYLPKKPENIYGIDISWSRLKHGLKFANEQGVNEIKVSVADLFHLPFKSNSVDMVLSNHSLEPNGGREKEALKELYRVSRKYIFMNEPSFEFGNEDVKNRIRHHGYVKNLSKHALDLGYKVVKNKLFKISMNPDNPTGTTIIFKDNLKTFNQQIPLACPVTKSSITLVRGSYYSQESKLVYPIIDNIPIFLKTSAVMSFYYDQF